MQPPPVTHTSFTITLLCSSTHKCKQNNQTAVFACSGNVWMDQKCTQTHTICFLNEKSIRVLQLYRKQLRIFSPLENTCLQTLPDMKAVLYAQESNTFYLTLTHSADNDMWWKKVSWVFLPPFSFLHFPELGLIQRDLFTLTLRNVLSVS